MSFFVTSAGPGNGGDLGGLAGADAHCAALAEAAGVTGRTWAAYLSTSEVDARDRIGDGPWHNAAGELIAESVEALHGDGNAIAKATALDETGAGGQRPRRRAEPPRHPDRLAARRHGGGRDLRGLDEQRRGDRRHGRPPRPHRPRQLRGGALVELVACHARRLRDRGAARHRRRRPLLLLRRPTEAAPA